MIFREKGVVPRASIGLALLLCSGADGWADQFVLYDRTITHDSFYTIIDPPSGVKPYPITLRVIMTIVSQGSPTIPPGNNQSPRVRLTRPEDGSSLAAPATITLSADALDGDGTVTRVEFFQGTTKLGEDSAAPYSFTWNSVAQGTYTLTARATDDDGATAISAPATITVVGGGAPPPPGPGPDREGQEGCGATGMELLGILGLFELARRRAPRQGGTR